MDTAPTNWISQLHSLIFNPQPRPGLHPIPGSRPLTFEAAVLPPLLYYVALLFLAPPPPTAIDSIYIRAIRNVLAATAGILFFRLPLAYHVPQSIGLTYQLGLVGLYGGCRVIDAFFISPYGFNHVPRRVTYVHRPRIATPVQEDSKQTKEWSNGGVNEPYTHEERRRGSIGANAQNPLIKTDRGKSPGKSPEPTELQHKEPDTVPDTSHDSYFSLQRTLSGPDPQPVLETATTESGWPQSFQDRACWALELELSMRGVGFTWTTADVRHARKTWLPTVGNRVHSILVHVLPILLVSWAVIKTIYVRHLMQPGGDSPERTDDGRGYRNLFDDNLRLPTQLALTGALGAFLMAAFSLGHSLFAIMLSPLAPSPLAFFPPLYSRRIWDITSVRKFWSYGWHRLFARLFLVYGVWPGEWLERKITGKSNEEPADVGKVLGGFLSSAFVHSFSVRGVVGGDWSSATGEAKFFALNGLAVILEGVVMRTVKKWRKAIGYSESTWYDKYIGRVWWLMVLLGTGRNFARGWVKSGLVREIAFM
ncbi:hypothetical protein SLS62_005771 [Diatrype stigma]|uniref:Wax synthase domain-containing protein n=1 Tax=Diatrype stigma TaxID=117547 RepID=A0AAN9YRT4_9PEZI